MKTAIEDIFSCKDFTTPSLTFKDIDGKKGIVTGYFADFNTIDSDGDVIKQGAFTKTIAATGPNSPKPRIKHLMNHSVSQPLGVLSSLKEDGKGLLYESKIGTHSLGIDFIKMAESGLITEHSIGYRTLKYNQVKPYDDFKEGDVARELVEVKLYEGSSLTAWGANPNTPLTGIKSLNQTELNKIISRSEAIEKFCRDTEATDETIEMLLLYSKQLLQVIADNVLTSEGDNKNPDGSNSTTSVLAIVPDESKDSLIKIDSVVECPNCKKVNYNSKNGKSAIKCTSCNKTFVPGLNYAFIL